MNTYRVYVNIADDAAAQKIAVGKIIDGLSNEGFDKDNARFGVMTNSLEPENLRAKVVVEFTATTDEHWTFMRGLKRAGLYVCVNIVQVEDPVHPGHWIEIW